MPDSYQILGMEKSRKRQQGTLLVTDLLWITFDWTLIRRKTKSKKSGKTLAWAEVP
jgi:hypothetical protein